MAAPHRFAPHVDRLLNCLQLAGIAAVLAMALTACDKKPAPETPATVEPTPVIDKGRVNQAGTGLWQSGAEVLSAATTSASELQNAVDQFVAAPSATSLKTAQQKWQAAFMAYRPFYFFQFLGQSAPPAFNSLVELNFRIAAHPIQPGYLDSFGPYQYSGLVHDIGMEISRENLIGQHGLTNSEDAVLGLYAIHFMLFGIDGNRVAEDYAPVTRLSREDRETGFESITETPNNRRRTLLQLQTNILVDDLGALSQSWQSSEPGSLQSEWQATEPLDKLYLVRRTLLQALTQLIVEVVDLKKMQEADAPETAAPTPGQGSEPSTAAESDREDSGAEANDEENTFDYTSYPAADQKQFILLSIESLLDATPVLRKEKREEIEKLLTEISQLLAQSAGTQEDVWTGVYQNLKAAVDALNAVIRR